MTDQEIEDVVNILLEKESNTFAFYFDSLTERAEKRESLHEQIINDILNQNFWPSERMVYFLGGAPANGKSTFLKQNPDKCPLDVLRIDADEIKKMLPEYNYMVEQGILEAAFLVHEESSLIARKVRKRAIEKGHDLVIDGIADDTMQAREEVYNEFRNAGYYIIMHYVTLDTALSLNLAEKRAAETGRLVPAELIEKYNKAIALLLPEFVESQLFDELYLWDTNDMDNTHLILRKINRKLEILRPDLYKKFKMKGHEENEG